MQLRLCVYWSVRQQLRTHDEGRTRYVTQAHRPTEAGDGGAVDEATTPV